MIQFTCPNCGAIYKLSDSFVGKRVRCGICGERASVPVVQAAPRTIIFDCPNCKSRYELPEELAGKPFHCQGCNQEQLVIALDTLETVHDSDEPATPAKAQPPSASRGNGGKPG
jgi:predicted Zn finger-like uncharacterized protein